MIGGIVVASHSRLRRQRRGANLLDEKLNRAGLVKGDPRLALWRRSNQNRAVVVLTRGPARMAQTRRTGCETKGRS